MNDQIEVKLTVGGVKIGAARFSDVHASGLRVHDGILVEGRVSNNAWGSERIAKYRKDCRRHKVAKALRVLRIPTVVTDLVGPRHEPPTNFVTLHGSYITFDDAGLQVPA